MWESIKELVSGVAPTVGTLIGGPAGAAVGTLVAKVLGVEDRPEAIEEALKNNPDALVKIRELETSKELAILKMELEHKQEDNRHVEHYVDLEVEDKQNARGAQHLVEIQSKIAGKVYNQSAWAVPLLLLMNALLIVFAAPLGIDVTAIVAIGNLIGIALSNQYRERQSVLEYLFGSSLEKKDK